MHKTENVYCICMLNYLPPIESSILGRILNYLEQNWTCYLVSGWLVGCFQLIWIASAFIFDITRSKDQWNTIQIIDIKSIGLAVMVRINCMHQFIQKSNKQNALRVWYAMDDGKKKTQTEDNVGATKWAIASKMIGSMSISCDMLSFDTYFGVRER